MNKKAMVVGGSNGVGFAVTQELLARGYARVTVVGRRECQELEAEERVRYIRYNLVNRELDFLREAGEIDTLFLSAGIGRVAPFNEIDDAEVQALMKTNTLAILRILQAYADQIYGNKDFYCGVMSSIAGMISSPLFAVYGASKAALCSCLESINAELAAGGRRNRVLCVAPGALQGTRFSGGENDIAKLGALPQEIVERMLRRETLYIPDYDATYANVLARYRQNPAKFGTDSYIYKQQSGRTSQRRPFRVGYLSGTFDLFHIGHLNLLRRAKENCEYLIVGVHTSGAWKGKRTFIPLEERLAILQSITYVDKAVEAPVEDIEAYEKYHFDFLFVGSDYKGTERFKRYEEFFRDKPVEIVYFPYTQGTSSTELREALDRMKQNEPPR